MKCLNDFACLTKGQGQRVRAHNGRHRSITQRTRGKSQPVTDLSKSPDFSKVPLAGLQERYLELHAVYRVQHS